MILRPGPATIPPAAAPGGMVLHVYAVPAGVLLSTSHLTPGDDVDADAERAARQIDDLLAGVGVDGVCIVAYDGDTGARMTPAEWMRALL